MNVDGIATLGALRASGYQSLSIKEELRRNLIQRIKAKVKAFEGIVGFDQTVVPDLERAILSRHHILLLGLRGQAKTRIARLMTTLLDPYIPVLSGHDLNDDPLHPITSSGRQMVADLGDDAPVSWLARHERYVEKLATPDVSVADLIGDIDPIKAAALKLPYSDDRVIHYGLVPRAHRCIFVINELPDLQARIQVSLFNILQEGDIQIRGFKLRIPLDIQFVFTANPEDYTSRGSIITPLKDRIESQILTHYPLKIEDAIAITRQEAQISADQKSIVLPPLVRSLVERIAIEARESELVDDKSGVSARLSISALENLVSAAERRMLINAETDGHVRLSDFIGAIPSITGKIELVYEGEQEGQHSVALELIAAAFKTEFLLYFADPDKNLKKGQSDPFEDIRTWFSKGNTIQLLIDMPEVLYQTELRKVPGLSALAKRISKDTEDVWVAQELILHALAEFNVVHKELVISGFTFSDLLADMLDELN